MIFLLLQFQRYFGVSFSYVLIVSEFNTSSSSFYGVFHFTEIFIFLIFSLYLYFINKSRPVTFHSIENLLDLSFNQQILLSYNTIFLIQNLLKY